MEAIHGSVQTTIHPHLWKLGYSQHRWWHAVHVNNASTTSETYLSTLQPDVLQFIINLPILPNTSEKASETRSIDSSSWQKKKACADNIFIQKVFGCNYSTRAHCHESIWARSPPHCPVLCEDALDTPSASPQTFSLSKGMWRSVWNKRCVVWYSLVSL